MMGISTHVLDTAKGHPAAGVGITLEDERGVIARGVTDADGRLKLIDDPPAAGTYRITFDTAGYEPNGFFPRVVIEFRVIETRHYHVPLLLSPFGYSTYRGS
ncbi:MAG TPA: hydroxyisourate hydrolase [Thermoanaerobaculia bacterium]